MRICCGSTWCRPLARFGPTPKWLEVHIFFGIGGPLLVTLHTAFKFNGVIAVGYWLMVAVWTSGFAGRYLYVRILKAIRGAELSRDEIAEALAATRSTLATASPPPAARTALDEFDQSVEPAPRRPPGLAGLFFGELRVRMRLFAIRRQLREAGCQSARGRDGETRRDRDDGAGIRGGVCSMVAPTAAARGVTPVFRNS